VCLSQISFLERYSGFYEVKCIAYTVSLAYSDTRIEEFYFLNLFDCNKVLQRYSWGPR